MNKKAVSPLIAAVLLIAFTVAIGAVVMTWGRNFVQTNIDKANDQGSIQSACSLDAKLDIYNSGQGYEVCSTPNGLNITVMNTGSTALAGFRLVAVVNNGTPLMNDTIITINPGDVTRYSITYPNGWKTALGMKGAIVTPYVLYSGQPVLCSNTKSQVNTVPTC
jgi:flagellin-like protein